MQGQIAEALNSHSGTSRTSAGPSWKKIAVIRRVNVVDANKVGFVTIFTIAEDCRATRTHHPARL